MIKDHPDAMSDGGYFTYSWGTDFRDNANITMRYTKASKSSVEEQLKEFVHTFAAKESTLP